MNRLREVSKVPIFRPPYNLYRSCLQALLDTFFDPLKLYFFQGEQITVYILFVYQCAGTLRENCHQPPANAYDSIKAEELQPVDAYDAFMKVCKT